MNDAAFAAEVTMNFARTALSLTLIGFSTAGFAAPPVTTGSEVPPGSTTFAQLDANRDGVLTFAEAFSNPNLSNNFNALDKNADGVLTPDEVQGIVR